MNRPLNKLLLTLQPGMVSNTSAVERILADEWDSFAGSSEGGMQSYKLPRRTEDLCWQPPILSFTIERHGAAVNGSTRAELQDWEIHTEAWAARIVSSRRRQLRPASKRLDVRPLAQAIADGILNDTESASLKKLPDGRVKVLIGMVVPDNGFEQTTTGRRKRFREAPESLLSAGGWLPAGVNTYERKRVA